MDDDKVDDSMGQGAYILGPPLGTAGGVRHGELSDAIVTLLSSLIDTGATQLKDGRAYQQDEWAQLMVNASRILAFHNSMKEQREMQAKYAASLSQSPLDTSIFAQKRRTPN